MLPTSGIRLCSWAVGGRKDCLIRIDSPFQLEFRILVGVERATSLPHWSRKRAMASIRG